MRSPSQGGHPWQRSWAVSQTAPCSARPAPHAPLSAHTCAHAPPNPARCHPTAPRRPPWPCAARAS
eukprot:14444-Prymnesium_polylepis.1